MVRVLGIDAGLDRAAIWNRGGGWHFPCFIQRQADHPLDEINAGHQFRHTMLDLQAGVHFEEEEIAAIRIVDELDGAGGAITHAFAQLHGGGVEGGTGFIRQSRRGGFLEDFLIPALDGTIAFAECQHPAFSIAENLHFHMAAALDETFDEHAAGAEAALAQADDGFKLPTQFRFIAADFHADPATARGALEHDRIADGFGGGHSGFGVFQKVRARNQRNARLPGQTAGFVLEAEGDDLFRCGTQPFHASLLAHAGEVGVFAKQSVAGENRGRAG